jgi:hypothetical protein
VVALTALIALASWGGGARAQSGGVDHVIAVPDQMLTGVLTPVEVSALGEAPAANAVALELDGETHPLEFDDGVAIPYAVTAGLASVVGLLAIGFGVPWWIVLPIAGDVVVALLVWFGRTVEDVADRAADTGPAPA